MDSVEDAVTTEAGGVFQLSITLTVKEFVRLFNLARLLKGEGITSCCFVCGHFNSFSLFKRSMLFNIL